MGDGMDFYEMIKNMTDVEIEKCLACKICNLENESKNINKSNVIGYNIPCNLSKINLLNKDGELEVEETFLHMGFVSKTTKVVYGNSTSDNGMAASGGCYYFVDEESYIYDFCKFIKNVNVYNEEDFFEYVLLFINDYFGSNPSRTRDEMFQLILKTDYTYYEPINEHKFSDFKKKGNAKCTEYAVMANNILSVFDFDSCIVLGKEKYDFTYEADHAFNVVSYTDNNNQRVDALIDFAHSVDVYDITFEKVGNSPYVVYFDNTDGNFVDKFLWGKVHLIEDDYSYMATENKLFKLYDCKIRDYSVSNSKISVKMCQM